MRLLLVPILALVAHASLSRAPAQQTVFRTRADVVVIDVFVSDGRKPILHLTKDDFEVRDNGVVQQVLDLSRETLPLDLTVTMDISGSMSPNDRAVVGRAFAQVSASLTPADRASVLTFSTHVTERSPLRHPPVTVELSTRGAGGSAVLDALLLSIVTPPAVDRRQFVLFMTDGDDNASHFDGQTVVETARHANAPTAIVLVPNRASRAVLGVLKAVAATTGGELIELERNDTLSQAFLTALENFRTSYMLRYSPSGVAPTGWHNITVRVKSKNYNIRARRGYWADPGR